MSSSLNRYAIILAAGEASRFGSPKQLQDWNDNSLLQHTINMTKSLFENNIIVVLGAYAGLIQAQLDENEIMIETNHDWQSGISSSIRAGVRALPDEADSVMILLCDQPLINTVSLKKLIGLSQQQPQAIVASAYQDTLGVPAIFPQSFFSHLALLQGDKGAKALLMSENENVLTVSMPEASIDIDTQEELQDIKLRFND